MRRERAIRIALTCGAALVLLCLGVATTGPRQAASPDESAGVAGLFESTLAFVREISRTLEHGGHRGAVIQLLIIVEVLIAALGVVSCMTVGGKVKADLVYRIVDVMGALFIIIALLLIAMTAV